MYTTGSPECKKLERFLAERKIVFKAERCLCRVGPKAEELGFNAVPFVQLSNGKYLNSREVMRYFGVE